MIVYRLIAECDGKSRARTITDRDIPKQGDEWDFGHKLGPQTVASAEFGNGQSFVIINVTPEKFQELTMVEGWSAVE